ncbi:MAG: DNA polymerase III subunit gamma/tau [Mariprofundus sp.]
MSYLVLARRFRPKQFSDLVGQDVVVRTLKNALSGGNLAHAYLLCGIRGVGKTTIARLMAMAVNCEQAVAGEPCCACSACTSIAGGSNLDVQELDAASHTGVDDMREILDGVRYPPVSLKTRVYIIDEAHMLSKSAFNALLKTLEEPPEHVLFILATTEAEKLPVTVRSRCQRFDLRRLGLGEIADYLGYVFAQESIEADSDALAAIARAADGSVRDALSLSERVLAYAGKQIKLADVDAALGQVGIARMRALSHAVMAGDAQASVELLRQASAGGHAARTLLQALARLWHQLACLQVDDSLLGEEADAEQRQWLQQYRTVMSGPALDMRYQVLLSGMRDLSLVDERMGAEMILMRLCGLKAISATAPLPEEAVAAQQQATPVAAGADKAVSVAAPIAEQTTLETPRAQPPLPEPTATATVAPTVQEASIPADSEHLQLEMQSKAGDYADWAAVVTAVHAFKPGLAAMLEHVQCLEFGDKVRLALDKHQQAMINAGERRTFAEWLGREVFWEARRAGEGESISQERDRLARVEKARMRQHAEADPHVQALMQEMDAQLINVLPPGVADQG